MKAQEWLENNYPNKEAWIEGMHINQQLEGILDCSEYKSLRKIYISTSVDSSKLEIIKGSYDITVTKYETEIIPCQSAQEWLDKNYPKDGTCVRKHDWRNEENHEDFGKKRAEIKRLNIRLMGLEGTLDLSDFTNLEELDCWNNCLTNLNVNSCKKLKKIYCSDNYLTHLIYPSNLENITDLNIMSNNLSPTDLTVFSQMRNLERLWIGNNKDKNKIHQGIYNKIEGSLEPLKNLNNLWKLNISNTDINSGWEYLPDSLNEFDYDTELKPDCKLAQVKEGIKSFWFSQQSKRKINKFIQEAQVEKIPYEQFTYINYLAEGGFGKIYQAEWKNKLIILKSLNNSQQITPEFLWEIASHKLFDYETKIVKCHGISQDKEGNYVMVMDYARGGNLRDYLQKNNKKLDLKKKLIQLSSIADGLYSIHNKGLVHKDFHLGNILSSGSEAYFVDLQCYITDLGLCKPVSVENKEDGIFGVLPYVAPEVLQNQPYTKKSDIYSFAMVAYGIIAGHPPYYNQSYNTSLSLKICQGLRPSFQIQVPQLLLDLIKKCWDTDPTQRPTIEELSNNLDKWNKEVGEKQNTEFTQQLQEAEAHNQTLPNEIKYPKYELHIGAVQHSKLINTKQITAKLQEIEIASKDLGLFIPDEVEEEELIVSEVVKEKDKLLEELEKEEKNSAELKKELDNLQEKFNSSQKRIKELKTKIEEFQTQIQIPPKTGS